MASVFITKRGKKFVCRYRLGGRSYPIVHAGSFRTEREAKERLRFVSGEIAAGRNPADALRAVVDAPARRTLRARFEEFEASRVDVGPKTLALYRNARDRLRSLASLEPHEITAANVQAWIAENSTTSDEYPALAPKSLGHYLSTLRQVLDYADVQPNPARAPKVKLPERVREEVSPPTQAEWQLIRANLSKRVTLAARLIECDGLRVSEALSLTYGDVDFNAGRIRQPRTNEGTHRWATLVAGTGRTPRRDRRTRSARGQAPRPAGLPHADGYAGPRRSLPGLS